MASVASIGCSRIRTANPDGPHATTSPIPSLCAAPADTRPIAAPTRRSADSGSPTKRNRRSPSSPAAKPSSCRFRRRRGIARAVATAPDLLLVDEPTAQLDRASAQTVNGVLAGLAEAGAIVLVASHDADTIRACDRAVDLRVAA